MRKLKADWILVMLASIQFRTFYFLICCLKDVKIRIYKAIILPVVLYGCVTWSLDIRGRT
jgi:hypothetical protein